MTLVADGVISTVQLDVTITPRGAVDVVLVHADVTVTLVSSTVTSG